MGHVEQSYADLKAPFTAPVNMKIIRGGREEIIYLTTSMADTQGHDEGFLIRIQVYRQPHARGERSCSERASPEDRSELLVFRFRATGKEQYIKSQRQRRTSFAESLSLTCLILNHQVPVPQKFLIP